MVVGFGGRSGKVAKPAKRPRAPRLTRGTAVTALLLLAGCGGGTASLRSGGASEDRPAPIRIVGSSTVYPFTTAVAEQFSLRFLKFPAPIVESTGTGGGIKLFCEAKGPNAPDMVNASRRMKPSEYALCRANGVTEIIEVQVGLDGLALARSRRGPDFGLSERDIYLALAARPFGRPQTARTWRDVNPALPDVRIEVIGPPPTSGTRDSFNEMFMEDGCLTEPAMKALKARDERRFKEICTAIREDGRFVEGGENDNLIVMKLTQNPVAIGVFGFSYFDDHLDKLKAVKVNGVEPSFATIADGRYPGARPLYIYARADRARMKPGIREFLATYATEAVWGPGGLLEERGLTPAPTPVRAAFAARARGLVPINPAEL